MKPLLAADRLRRLSSTVLPQGSEGSGPTSPHFADHWRLFKMDAARWIEPEQIGDPGALTPRTMVALLIKYRSLRATTWFRLGSWIKYAGVRGTSGVFQRHLLRSFGLEIPIGSYIEGGLYIAHPTGVTITCGSIGENASIVALTTIGRRKGGDWPVIGDRVYLGTGAKVIGGIAIGDDVKVGANAVVLDNVPSGATVVGIPARVLSR